MSLQVQVVRSLDTPSAAATEYLAALNGQYWDTSAHRGTAICTAAGTCSNFSVVLPTAPGATKSLTFTLLVNGVASAAVVAISGTATSGTYTATTVALADGDEIAIRCVPSGTPAVSTPSICWDFTGTTAAESIYGSGNTKGPIAANRVNGVLGVVDVTNWSAPNPLPVVACPGAITKVTIKLDVDVTASGSVTFTIVKNGTAQNGGGGTPDTRVTFTTGTTKASATFSLAVVAGDVLTWSATQTGAPATVRPITGVRLTATTAGQSQFGSPGSPALATGTSTVYAPPAQGRDSVGDAVEATRAVTLGPTGFVLRDLRATLNTTPTGGTVAVALRKNSASGAQSVTITPPAAAASTSAATTYAAGDTIAVELVGTTVPSARVPSWACIQDQGAAPAVATADTYVWGPV